MKIRFAKQKDKKDVLRLLDELIACANKYYREEKRKYKAENEVRGTIYNEAIKRGDIKIFVVEENGKLIGMAELFIVPILRRGYHQGVVETFVITETLRGRGIGSKLFQTIKDYCKRNNIKVIKLTSSIELTDSHRFYEKHGGKFTEKLFRFDLT